MGHEAGYDLSAGELPPDNMEVLLDAFVEDGPDSDDSDTWAYGKKKLNCKPRRRDADGEDYDEDYTHEVIGVDEATGQKVKQRIQPRFAVVKGMGTTAQEVAQKQDTDPLGRSLRRVRQARRRLGALSAGGFLDPVRY